MPHYYSEKQDSELNLKKIEIRLKQISFSMYTAGGIFSKGRLDTGTRLLIENAQIGKNDDILDLGCGIGVVGIAVKLMHPEAKVTMSDINERAVMIALKNVKTHNLGIEVLKSNLYEKINKKFDTILVNPPQTAGREVCFAIIEGAYTHLEKSGSLQLVARHKKGGSMLEKKMQEVFGNVETSANGSGYRVYLSRKTIS
ncbi:TPA: class I SAM-dependent methyltransferase [Candidatus Woesearchaeota archaeon]|nr:Methyltransferase small [archaeon GW2011_AR15]MBS3103492.1 class I SAM-dependent methyltransferase [Candidatus Woesearchaeota archaeon]HIH41610.1 class I SAM-dependent methyltransferase [Candidatus Woesearchaeota archaeon]